MSLVAKLADTPGVIAAGEYTYRGDRFSYQGQLDEEQARMASIMCRAANLTVHMQANMLKSLNADCGCAPARGWAVKGQAYSICVIANYFCFVDNNVASLNKIMTLLLEMVPDQDGAMV